MPKKPAEPLHTQFESPSKLQKAPEMKQKPVEQPKPKPEPVYEQQRDERRDHGWDYFDPFPAVQDYDMPTTSEEFTEWSQEIFEDFEAEFDSRFPELAGDLIFD